MDINRLKKGVIGQRINDKVNEFSSMPRDAKHLFSELCFCTLTANTSAESGLKVQNKLYNKFHVLNHEQLSGELKEMGYRFPNVRSTYICENQKIKNELAVVIKSMQVYEIRDWLVKNVKGIGFKEASHFLRNIGFMDVAIIDFHIIDILVKNGLIDRPKTLTKKKYIEIEHVLRKVAFKAGLRLGELDLYLWYLETDKILK